MEKIFEDKEFHGDVKFFKNIQAIGATLIRSINYQGTPHGNSFFEVVCDSDDLELKGKVLKIHSYIREPVSGSDWRSSFHIDTDFYGLNGWANVNGIVGMANNLSFQNAGTVVAGAAYRTVTWVGESDVTNLIGYRAEKVNTFGSGIVTNYFGFRSDSLVGSPVTNGWHFYGEGDFPSFFGGEIQQTEKDITASTPPTQAEMVSALGAASAHPDASLMVKVTAGSHFRVFSDGTSWFYSAYTVGA